MTNANVQGTKAGHCLKEASVRRALSQRRTRRMDGSMPSWAEATAPEPMSTTPQRSNSYWSSGTPEM